MRDNQGSAVAIVLLMLGVSSLVGVALVSQSRLDMRLTSSVQVYDRIFSVADGAAAIACNYLKRNDPMKNREYTSNTTVQIDVPDSQGTLTNRKLVGDLKLSSTAILMGPPNTMVPGYEIGEFQEQYWRADGKGDKTHTNYWLGGGSTATSSTVHAAVTKVLPNR